MPFSRLFFFILICFWQHNPLCAQPEYSATRYDNQNGLPSNSIKGLAYDSASGMLWIGSEGGLTRFDGYRFYNISLDNRKGLSPRISVLRNVHDNNIYFYTDEKRLYVLRNNVPTLVKSYPNQAAIQAKIKKLSLVEKCKLSLAHSILYELPFWAAIDKMQGQCLVADMDSAWFYDERVGRPVALGKFANTPMPFTIGHAFFIADGRSMYKLNKQTMQLEPHTIAGLGVGDTVLARPFYNLTLQNDSRFLFTQNKLWTFNLQDGQLQASALYTDLPAQHEASAVVEIPNMSMVVVGSATDGLMILRRRIVINKKAHSIPPSGTQVLYEQVELGPDTVLSYRHILLTNGDGQPPNNTGIKRTFHYLKDTSKNLWYYFPDSVYRYNLTNKTQQRYLLKDNSAKVVVVQTKRGIMAVSNYGVYLFQDNSFKVIVPNKKDAWEVDAVINLTDSTLLFATQKGVMECNIYTGSISLTPIDPVARVRCLWKYGHYIFMGTYGQGILLMKKGIIKKIPLDCSANLLFTHCFVPDDNGYCFMSTNNGILKASIQAMVAAYDSDLKYVYYHYIGKKDGMETTELNGSCQPCALRLHNGYMSFPSLDGLKWLHPDAVTLPPSGNVSFDEVVADDSLFSQHSSLNFKADTRLLQFRFSIPYWGNQENLYCFYRLVGHNNVWHPFNPAELSVVSYSNLGYGDYRFEIKVLTGFEQGQEKTSYLSFIIARPWYLQWWFFALALLASVLLVGWFVHLRTDYLLRKSVLLQKQIDRQTKYLAEQKSQLEMQVKAMKTYQTDLEESNNFKSRLISIIGHDIITPLRFMRFLGNSISKQKEPMPPEMTERIGHSISSSAKDMEDMSANMLNWIKVQQQGLQIAAKSFSPYEIATSTIHFFQDALQAKGILVKNNIDPNICIHQFEEPVRIILHNVLMNAERYSTHGSITIDAMKLNGNNFELSITDEGQGMSEEKVQQLLHPVAGALYDGQGHGLGFQIIRDMVRLINGLLEIESMPGKGTIVYVTFPSFK